MTKTDYVVVLLSFVAGWVSSSVMGFIFFLLGLLIADKLLGYTKE